MTEDPSLRRNYGGGQRRDVIVVYPMFRPEIEFTGDLPSIFHSDLSLVTVMSPARPGELLIARAIGLGPIKPGHDAVAIAPFHADPPDEVNSPVQVEVAGKIQQAIVKIGWPGTLDRYRIEFRTPDDVGSGTAAIRLVSAWIPGSQVSIPVRGN